jgi:hypothetical protein
MTHGGKREGSGRKQNSLTKKTREIAEASSEQGVTPLEYMLDVLRNAAEDPDRRAWAAEKAAPYMHAKLATVEHKGNKDNPLSMVARIELVPLSQGNNATSGDN